MKGIRKKLLIILTAIGVATFGFGAVACSKIPWESIAPYLPVIPPVDPDPGPGPDPGPAPEDPSKHLEYGSYYYNADGQKYALVLGDGCTLTLTMGDTVVSAKYTIDESGNITASDVTPLGSTVSAVWNQTNQFVTVTYNKTEVMRFFKSVYYTVTFDSNGGSEVKPVSVLNGEFATQPADPTKEGYKFLGWYVDNEDFAIPFSFTASAIRKNTTLYACWAEYTPGQTEYTVSFDLNCDDAVGAPEDRETIGCRLIGNIPTPTRDGYVFIGWWISMYDEPERLSTQFVSSYKFEKDTTLYAVWGSKSDDLWLSVDRKGVRYNLGGAVGQTGELKIYGPKDGDKNYEYVTHSISGGGDNYYGAFDFDDNTPGEYRVVLDFGGKTVTRYYANKTLARVKGFTVNNYVLTFDKVDGATKYYITVNCGNKAHVHDTVDLGNSTTYNFMNCDMQEGGIKFTVTAEGEGFADSVSKVFAYAPTLAVVSGYNYDTTTGYLTWSEVENATSYIVQINGGTTVVVKSAAFDLKKYTGALNIEVTPAAYGWISPEGVAFSHNKSEPVSPYDLRIVGNELSWTGSADKYEVRIGNRTYETEGSETTMTLDMADIVWAAGNDYQISVRSLGTKLSLWSDPVDARYSAIADSVVYEDGVIYWSPVIGADRYVVTVNSEEGVIVNNGATSLAVALTQAGENTITVRFEDDDASTPSSADVASVNVFAYTVTFDANNGSGANPAPIYLAAGDTISLSDKAAERPGYRLTDWYNGEGGAAGNAKRYKDGYTVSGNLNLFAQWASRTYQAKYYYGSDYSQSGSKEVLYGVGYTLPVPGPTADGKVFGGWYTEANGQGSKYADETGSSGNKLWSQTDDEFPLYAFYADVLEYTEDGDGYMVSVKTGPDLSKISNLVVPSEYNGKPVISVAQYGFNNTMLKTVSLPDTIQTIPLTAFDRSTDIESFTVYEAGGVDPAFTSVDGAIIYNNPTTDAAELWMVPFKVANSAGVYEIPYGVTSVVGGVFSGRSFKEIVVPASVTGVHSQAFVSSSLRAVTFADAEKGEAVEELTIDVNAFGSGIETLTLPARFTKANNDGNEIDLIDLLSPMTSLKAVNFVGEYANAKFKSGDGMIYNKEGDTILYCPAARDGAVVIDSEIVNIGPSAFEKTKITSVTFHGSMESIGKKAFYNLDTLTNIVFTADNPTGRANLTIGESAFEIPSLSRSVVDSIVFEEIGSFDEDGIFTPTLNCGVKTIGARAFYGRGVVGASPDTLCLPSTLESIGDSAFAYNRKLVGVDLSHVNSDLTFGDNVFAYCTAMGDVDITLNVGYVPFSSVFYKCPASMHFTIAEGHPYYSTDSGNSSVILNADKTQIAYFPKEGISTYTVPATIKELVSGVFTDSAQLTSITIHSGVESIGANAFKDCTALDTVTFAAGGNKPLTLGDGVFSGCSSLKTISLPDRTESIGANAFTGSGLNSITLNTGLLTIGTRAFEATAITTVTIPYTVTAIGSMAFSNCQSLETVVFAATPGNETVIAIELGDRIFLSCKALTTVGETAGSVVLPEGRFESIPSGMFRGCISITNVTVPTTVADTPDARGIGEYAFYDCSNLSSVTFADADNASLGALSFGAQAFYNTSESFNSLYLPARAAEYNSNSYDVFALGTSSNSNTMISFTDSQGNLGTHSNGLQTITVSANNAQFAAYDGVLYSKDYSVVVFCPAYHAATVTVHEKAAEVRPNAFYRCAKVATVNFTDPEQDDEDEQNQGADYKRKGANDGASTRKGLVIADATLNGAGVAADAAFFECTSLKTIRFPRRLTSIGEYAFYSKNGSNLETVEFAEGCKLTSIGKKAFANSNLKGEFVMPDKVSTVGAGVFDGCTQLVELTVSELMDSTAIANALTGSSVSTLNVPDGSVNAMILSPDGTELIFVGKSYIHNARIRTLEIPATVTTIKDSAFEGVTMLETITFEAGTADLTIGDNAFKNSSIKNITLPARVKSLGVSAFEGCANLTSVTLAAGYRGKSIPNNMFKGSAITSFVVPVGITTIGESAFEACLGLTEITFAGDSDCTVTEIGAYAFRDCSNPGFEAIILPNKINTLGSMAFAGAALKSIDASRTQLTAIPENAFAFEGLEEEYLNGTSTKTVKKTKIGTLEMFLFPQTLTTIGNSAFKGQALTSVTIPASVTALGTEVFDGCWKLKTAVVNANIIAIPDGLFRWCRSLESVTLRDIVKSIGTHAFWCDESLHSIDLPAGLTSFGSGAFDSSGLQSITIPAGISTIANLFSGCSELAEVTFAEGSALNSLGMVFKDCTSLVEVLNIPKGVTEIGNYCFSGCTSLERVTFEAGSKLETVGASSDGGMQSAAVFYNCYKLTTISFPDSLENLYGSAFRGSGIQTLDLSNTKITALYNSAFNGCTDLTTIKLPATVTSFGSHVFGGCTKLTTFKIGANNDNTFPAGFAKLPDGMFAGAAFESFTIDPSYTSISEKFFKGCANLTSVSMGAVTEIKAEAFYGCGFTSFTVPAGVEKLSDRVFAECTNLATLNFANINNLTDLGTAFIRNTKITSFTVPSSVVNISNSVTSEAAFAGANLTELTLTFVGGKSNSTTTGALLGALFGAVAWTGSATVTQSSSNTGLSYALRVPSSLKTVIVTGTPDGPGGPLTAHIKAGAFSGCTMIENVSIRAASARIDDYAFYGCTGLKTFDLCYHYSATPADRVSYDSAHTGTSTIGAYAFDGCTAFNSNGFGITNLSKIGYNAFDYGRTNVNIFSAEANSKNELLSGIVYKETPDATDYTLVHYYFSKSTSVTGMNKNIKVIGEYAFAGNTTVQTITLPDSGTNAVTLDAINAHAFDGCTSLSSITFAGSDSFTRVANYAFQNTALTAITLPAAVKSIGDYAFNNCASLAEVVLCTDKTKFPSIGTSSFDNVNSNFGFRYNGTSDKVNPDDQGVFYSSVSGTMYGVSYNGVAAMFYIGNGGEITIKSPVSGKSVVGINASAFKDKTTVTKVTIPATVMLVDDNAFDGCTGLTSVVFSGSSSLLKIGDRAFANTGITSFSIPNSTKLVGMQALADNASLKTLTVGADVIQIGKEAFAGASKLETVNYNAEDVSSSFDSSSHLFKAAGWEGKGITFKVGSQVTKIPNYFISEGTSVSNYDNRPNIVSIDFSGATNCTTIGAYAFNELRSLKTVDLGSHLTTIKSNAFTGDSGLTHISIPSSVTSIESAAFASCVSLAEIKNASSVALDFVTSAVPQGNFYNVSDIHYVLTAADASHIRSVNGYVFTYRVEYDAENHPFDQWYLVGYTGSDTTLDLPKTAPAGAFYNAGYNYSDPAVYASYQNAVNYSDPTTYQSYKVGQYAFSISFTGATKSNSGSYTDLKITDNNDLLNKVTSVKVPYAVTGIGMYAFTLPKAKFMYYDANITTDFSGAKEGPFALFGRESTEVEWTIGNHTTYVPGNLTYAYTAGINQYGNNCYYMAKVTSVIFEATSKVLSIGPNAFKQQNGNSVDLRYLVGAELVVPVQGGDPVTYAEALDIPDSVTSIGASAFENSLFKYIVVGCSVEEVGNNVFNGCSNLKVLDNRSFAVISVAAGVTVKTSFLDWEGYSWYDNGSGTNIRLVKPLSGTDLTGELVLPDGYGNGKLSYEISREAFKGITSFTSLVIPDSVTAIGIGAFSDCTNLTSVQIGRNVSLIDRAAFAGCKNLDTVTFDDRTPGEGYPVTKQLTFGDGTNTTQSNRGVFAGCSVLPSFKFESYMGDRIADFMFANCSKLLKIGEDSDPNETWIIPDNIVAIGNHAFYSCAFNATTGVKHVIIGKNVKTIGVAAFAGCKALIDVQFAKDSELTSIAAGQVTGTSTSASVNVGAFAYCSSLQKITTKTGDTESDFKYGFPSAIKVLPAAIFNYDTSLTGDFVNGALIGITEVGNWAFNYCSSTSFTSLTIAKEVKRLGYAAFANNTKLTSISFENGSALEQIDDGGTLVYTRGAFGGCSAITTITLPDTVTRIPAALFVGCSKLESVYIGDPSSNATITEIGLHAFNGCKLLEDINFGIPATQTTIYEKTFYQCNKLNITIPSTVTALEGYAFAECKALTTVDLSNVVSMGERAFYNCTGLESVTLSNNLTAIPDYCFYGCKLSSITIPDNVTSIGMSAFYNCKQLESVTVPAKVTSLGSQSTFRTCTSLTTVIIKGNITQIPQHCFNGCTRLDTIVLPSSLTTVQTSAFQNCSALSKVYYAGANVTAWNTISINSTNNTPLTNATKYYYSTASSKPTSGNYWHYNTSGVPVDNGGTW